MSVQSLPLDRQKTKSNKLSFLFFAFLILIFAVIVEKNIELPRFILYSAGGLGLFWLFLNSVSNPRIVLYVLTAYLPFSKILGGDFGGFMTAFNLTNILTIMAFLAWFSSALLKNRKFYTRTTLDVPLLIFMFLGCFSLVKGITYFGTVYAAELIFPLKRWLTPMLLFFIFFNIVRTKEEIKNITYIIMFVVFVAALMAIRDYMDVCGFSSLEKSRVGGIAEQPNMLAAFFVYYMFLFAGFMLVYWEKLKYWFLFLPFLACFRGIQVTFSRGGYLAFAAAAMVLVFFRSKGLFLFCTLILMFTALNPQFLPEGIRYRMSSTFSNDRVFTQSVDDVVDSSSRNRLEAWKGGIEIIKEHPLSGIGYGLFPYTIPYYAPVSQMDAHNTYILIASEMGIPALLAFLLILFIMLQNARRLYKSTRDKFCRALSLGFLGSLGGIFVSNIFGGRLDSQEVSSYFWILAALIFKALYIEKEEAKLSKKLVKA
ncbi:MAG: O-antigen ligase family protein [Candidatus Omnitrophota bacterium]